MYHLDLDQGLDGFEVGRALDFDPNQRRHGGIKDLQTASV